MGIFQTFPKRTVMLAGLIVSLMAQLVLVTPVKALEISPPKKLYVANPGDIISDKLKLIGVDQGITQVDLTVGEFQKTGDEDDRRFYQPSKDANSIGNWINIDDDLHQEVKFGEIVEVPFRIVVPVDAPPGGHYGTITAIVVNQATQGNEVGITSKLVGQYLLTVTGDVKEELQLESFNTKNGRRLFAHLPIEFVTKFKNVGNVHIIPRGFVEILQGEQKAKVIPINPKLLETFPQTSRKYDQLWEDSEPFQAGSNPITDFWANIKYEFQHFRIGLYTVRMGAVYGPQKNIVLQDQMKIVVFPWHLALVLLVLIVGMITFQKLKKRTKK